MQIKKLDYSFQYRHEEKGNTHEKMAQELGKQLWPPITSRLIFVAL